MGTAGMYTQVKTSGGINLIPIETKLFGERKLIVEGEITQETSIEFVKQLLILSLESDKLPIDVLINSEGGEVNSGLLMYDAVQSSTSPVRMFCLGRAYSMAAVLFASGCHGRFMLENSELMLHEPLIRSGIGGSCSTVRSISESMEATRQRINMILAKHTGREVHEIDEASSYDHFFTPKESIEFGLCDRIVGIDEIMRGGDAR